MLDLCKKLRVLLTPRDKYALLGLIALMMLGALLELAVVGLILPVVAIITKPELMQQNWYLKLLYDYCQFSSKRSFTLFMAVAVLLASLLKNAYALWVIKLQANFVYGKNRDLTKRLFHNYLHSPYPFFRNTNRAVLINNFNQLAMLPAGLLLPLMLISSEVLVVLALSGLLLFFAPGTTLGAAAAGLLLFGALYWPLKKASRCNGEKRFAINQALDRTRLQTFGGIKEIMAGNRQEFFQTQYFAQVEAERQVLTKLYVVGQIPRLAIEFAIIGFTMGVIAILLWLNLAAGSIILTLALLGSALYRLMPSLSRIHYNLLICRQYLPVFEQLYKPLTDLEQMPTPNADAPKLTFEHALAIKDLSFRYPDGEQAVFAHLNLTLAKHRHLGIRGVTGGGKSTLIDLILGLQKPDSGTITIDNVDIFANLPSYRSLLGFVPQNIYILDGSVRANVAFGLPDNEIDDAQIWQALEWAQLADTIREMPAQLDTNLGDQGIRLSGGQIQRLGIARALYGLPQILIFDEATSALDPETEKAVIDSLQNLQSHFTILTVAHRESTLQSCDQIITIN